MFARVKGRLNSWRRDSKRKGSLEHEKNAAPDLEPLSSRTFGSELYSQSRSLGTRALLGNKSHYTKERPYGSEWEYV
jgi:hypothetical protein